MANQVRNHCCNPRLKYLSWSKMNLFEKDPNQFYQVYFEGLDQYRSKFLELGSRLSKVLENGIDEERDPTFEFVATFLPAYPEREKDMKVVFEGVPLRIKLDGWNKKTFTVGEYKSGRRWTQSMVDKCDQLTFYAAVIWMIYKKIPNFLLHWAKTEEDEEGNLKLTGDLRTFKTTRRLKDIILMVKRMKKAWKEICEMVKFADGR